MRKSDLGSLVEKKTEMLKKQTAKYFSAIQEAFPSF